MVLQADSLSLLRLASFSTVHRSFVDRTLQFALIRFCSFDRGLSPYRTRGSLRVLLAIVSSESSMVPGTRWLLNKHLLHT